MARSFTSQIRIMVLILLLRSLRTIKINRIIFLTFISSFLLLYFSEPDIFTSINILFVLTMVTVIVVAVAAFAVTVVYVVIVTHIGTGFLILFIIFFISRSYLLTLLLYFF